MNGTFDDQHSDKSHGIPDSVHIVLDTRHQLTGVMAVEISHGQRLDMVEKILSQAAPDTRRRIIKDKFLHVLENGSSKADSQKQAHEHLHLSADDDIVNDVSRYLRRRRIQQNAHYHGRYGHHIQDPVLFYILP